MKQLVISSVELNRNFAFVKGNRQINAKAVAAKVKSIREYGQLSPITVVKGEDVYLSGGHLVDLDGNDIPDEQTEIICRAGRSAPFDGLLETGDEFGQPRDCRAVECRDVHRGIDCRNEYLYHRMERHGLYGRTLHGT